MRGQSTLYEVLQVDPRAEPEVIEAAYRRLARMYHPDVSDRLGADQRMKEINAAYHVLGDPARRGAYDRELLRAGPEEPTEASPMLGCVEHDRAVAVGTCEDCGAGLCVECFDRIQPPTCASCTLAWADSRRNRVWLALVWFFGVVGLTVVQLLRMLAGVPPAPAWLQLVVAGAGYLLASGPSGLAALGGREALAENAGATLVLGFAAVLGPFVAPFRMIKLGFELRQLARIEAITRPREP